MRSTFTVNKPDEVEMTLKITMPLKEWKNLKDQLCEKWPSSKLGITISNVIYKAELNVYDNQEHDAS